MRRLKITMEELLALVAIAEEGSLERAGEAPGLSRSAMGKQIGALEQAVGAPFFDHRRGKWIRNEEGRIFIPEAFDALARSHRRRPGAVAHSAANGPLFGWVLDLLVPRFDRGYPRVRCAMAERRNCAV